MIGSTGSDFRSCQAIRPQRSVIAGPHLLLAVLASLALLLCGHAAVAQASDEQTIGNVGQPCQANQSSLLVASNQLMTDCGYLTWCDPSANRCAARGCRRDEYPFGYSTIERTKWPKMCNSLQFCPDEGSYCMDKIELGGACQLNRDDECATNPAHPSVRCLHNQCVAVNASRGARCVHENVVYTVFTPYNSSYGSIVSRDNCLSGLYCDSPTDVCISRKAKGSPCSADKECQTDYCQDPSYTASTPDNNDAAGMCSDQPSLIATRHQVWVYPVIVLLALVAVGSLFVTLLKLHQSQGRRRREKQRAYWESQRLINDKARMYKDDLRTALSQPNSPQRALMYSMGSFDSAVMRGDRHRPYGAVSKADVANDSTASLLDSRSRPSSRNDGAATPLESGTPILQGKHSRWHQPASDLGDSHLPSIPASTYARMAPSTAAEEHRRNAALSDIDLSEANTMTPSPQTGELYLTPTHSRASLHGMMNDPFLDNDEVRAASTSATGLGLASAPRTEMRNRESTARGGASAADGQGRTSPNARRASTNQNWSFSATEGDVH